MTKSTRRVLKILSSLYKIVEAGERGADSKAEAKLREAIREAREGADDPRWEGTLAGANRTLPATA